MARLLSLLLTIYIAGVVVVLAMPIVPQWRDMTLEEAGSQISRSFPDALRWPVHVFRRAETRI
jgi:hypothetical protein